MANAPFHPLGDYGIIEMRHSGGSATSTYLSFQKYSGTTDHGVEDASANGECIGIWMSATTTTADTTGCLATGGVWKTTGTASDAFEPGDVFYIGSSTTIKNDGTHASSKSQGIICQSTTASGATTLYILLIPSQIYTATTYSSS